jgi:hypothetical protein
MVANINILRLPQSLKSIGKKVVNVNLEKIVEIKTQLANTFILKQRILLNHNH